MLLPVFCVCCASFLFSLSCTFDAPLPLSLFFCFNLISPSKERALLPISYSVLFAFPVSISHRVALFSLFSTSLFTCLRHAQRCFVSLRRAAPTQPAAHTRPWLAHPRPCFLHFPASCYCMHIRSSPSRHANHQPSTSSHRARFLFVLQQVSHAKNPACLPAPG
jgi:hypothetical protein